MQVKWRLKRYRSHKHKSIKLLNFGRLVHVETLMIGLCSFCISKMGERKAVNNSEVYLQSVTF